MKRSTLESIVKLSSITSTDFTRNSITYVNIHQRYNEPLQLSATNGHIGAIQTITDDTLPIGRYCFYQTDLPAAKLILKETAKFLEFDCDIDSNGGLIFGAFTKGRMIKADASEHYPDLESVFPKYNVTAAVTLNADYILDLAKLLQLTPKSPLQCRIVFDPTNTSKPVLFERNDVKGIKIVAMPIRDDVTKSISEKLKSQINSN